MPECEITTHNKELTNYARELQHAQLLTEIQSVDYAPPTLKQVQSHLASAQKQLDADKQALAKRQAET